MRCLLQGVEMPLTIDSSLALQARLFRGFADPSRLGILAFLRGGERSVSEIVASTKLSQPNVSAHLSCLRECGLVVSRQEGRNVYYSIADERLEDIFLAAEDVLQRVGQRVYECTRYER